MTGLIITFDDITELQSAQRKAAWSDVARRIAHEIKNPLTPIQLSAERLNKKYLKEIQNDPKTFEQCTQTIVKHVEDIGRMVDEFSSFARMPDPILIPQQIAKQIEDSILFAKQTRDDITIECVDHSEGKIVNCDAQQIRQVMNNLVKNAIEAIDLREQPDLEDGRIGVLIGLHNRDDVFISITDNGPGLPMEEDVSKLTEPYVTHKTKGTGLGLAIVKKIVEDHGGALLIGAPKWLEKNKYWKNEGGACFVVTLPLARDPQDIIEEERRKVG